MSVRSTGESATDRNEQIHEMNREFRGIDRATDVLSFPMIDYPEPGTFDFLEEEEDCFDPESGELTLGDIVISKEKSSFAGRRVRA